MINLHYDVKDEFKDRLMDTYSLIIKDRKADYAELTAFEKLMLYYVYCAVAPSGASIDCDSAKYTMEAWKKINPNVKDAAVVKQVKDPLKYQLLAPDDRVYRGDTLTSAWMPLKDYFGLCGTSEVPTQKIAEIMGTLGFKDLGGYRNKAVWAAYLLLERGKFEEKLSADMKFFLEHYHTLSNFLLVPANFNKKWAPNIRHDGTKWDINNDYGDLKLCAIREYYLSGESDKILPAWKHWLNQYKSWGEFVIQNNLKNHVNESGAPILYWDGHESGDKPTLEQLKCMFCRLRKILG